MINLDIAVPTPLPQTFTYAAERDLAPGTRVLVSFGKRRVVGVVMGQTSVAPGIKAGVVVGHDPAKITIKPIEKVIDDTPMYSPVVLELARWISSYYFHPIGEVLRTMLPASAEKVVAETYVLTPEGETARQAPATRAAALVAALFKRKPELSALTLKSKLKKLAATAEEVEPSLGAVAKPLTLKDLVKAGLITRTRGTSMKARVEASAKADQAAHAAVVAQAVEGAAGDMSAPIAAPVLTPKQQAVYQTIVDEGLAAAAAGEAPAKPFLLHGVTGAGKTEIYLHVIAEANRRLGDAAQALVLVPEISLTPQMTRVFERRFPGRVAVVHSAMSDAERWAALTRIRRGEATILIGPRSAVFAPFTKLALLIVDEEHDGSYKQATGLAYNGRDLAVLRGKLERATIILGSATPSMESFHNAQTGRYRLLDLPERVSGRALPTIAVIEMEKSAQRGMIVSARRAAAKAKDPGHSGDAAEDSEIPIDDRVVHALRANLANGHQAIVLVNRRGYAFYLFSLEKKKAVQCPSCSISLTMHARGALERGVLRCHYCDYATTVERLIAERTEETFLAIGYGSQKAEDVIRAQVPGARVVRLDSDTVVQKDYLPKTLAKFRAGEIDILVGTQILAKGHDFPKVTLIAILEVDQLLDLPDFRAGERTFQLIVQAAGRAGRAELPGEVLIQTTRLAHPVVAAAIRQDYAAFAKAELQFREAHLYPPFARMIALEVTSEDRRKLDDLMRRIEAWIEQLASLKPDLLAKVRVLGPAVPPIETIRRRHRRNVIFSSAAVEPLRQLTGHFLTVFAKLSGDFRLKVDVDPQSLI